MKKTTDVREPLVHITKRMDMPQTKAWLIRGIAFIISLLACGIFITSVAKISMIDGFVQMFQGTFGNFKSASSVRIRCWDTAFYTAKLLCIAVALAPAFKMKFWNIGAEGQVVIGGLVTAFFMRNLSGTMPAFVFYPLMIIASIAAGAVWGLIPATCNAK